MALTNKAKVYIRKHAGSKKPAKIAETLNLPLNEITEYIAFINKQPGNGIIDSNKSILFTIIAVFIPIVFFVLIEVALKIGNYRGNTDLFVYPPALPEYARPNNNFAARYFFYTRVIPTPNPDFFKKVKPENGFRIFVMGESSAAGYPYPPNGSFSRVVNDMLQDVLPTHEVEVINVGMSAINSYTLYDQVDEILAKEPDAIMIYTGHNEYYGALGIGSTENIGSFPAFVRFYLKIQRYKTFMLLRDGLVRVTGWFRRVFGSAERRDVTLMQQVVREQIIPLDSPVYELGSIQFRSNLRAIVRKFQKAGIPVYIGSVASNLRDHKPFESIQSEKHPEASSVYLSAIDAYNSKNFFLADSLFRYARDLDALRFRAATDINRIIREVSDQDGVHYVPVKETLTEAAENGIIGNDLMLEHLHLNQKGYFLIGNTFFNAFTLTGLPDTGVKLQNLKNADEYLKSMYLTRIDHEIVKHRIMVLTNNWPFVKNGPPFNYQGYRFSGIEDSLAFEIVANRKRWDEAKVELGELYREQGRTEASLAEFESLIRDQPYIDSPFVFAARTLLDAGQLERSYPYLIKGHAMDPSAYTNKMLGAVYVNRGNFSEGIGLLETSLEMAPNDIQAMYNLSGAYAQIQEYQKAMSIVNKIELVNPYFPGLQEWKNQLLQFVQQ